MIMYFVGMTPSLIVHTRSGCKADEYPLRFEIDGVCREIISIEDRWYDESYEAFRVFADDGRTYLLRHWVERDDWDLIGAR